MLVKIFFKHTLKYAIIAVHAFLLYSCNDSCTNPSTTPSSSSQTTDEELKSSAIKGLESIYFTGPGKVNPEIMALLNYQSVGSMKKAYEEMKEEIKNSTYLNEEKFTSSNGEQHTIREYKDKDNKKEPYHYLFCYNSEGSCIGFIKYFKNYHLSDEYIAHLAQQKSYKDIASSNFGYVDLIAVEKSERKKGAATRLMDYCEKKLREDGKKFCVLYTFNKGNVKGEKTALKFYKDRKYNNGIIKTDDTTYLVKKL